jgi:hypothetical protein
MDRRGRRRLELWPKMLPRLSQVVVIRERGQERRAQNQRSERFSPPKLSTPKGGKRKVGVRRKCAPGCIKPEAEGGKRGTMRERVNG